jgi:Protein of unknown function (DUF3800)
VGCEAGRSAAAFRGYPPDDRTRPQKKALGGRPVPTEAGLTFPKCNLERPSLLQPQACIDDSGNEPTKPHFILAGFVASAANWVGLSNEWRAGLDESPKLEYFKMKEAAGLKDQFDPKNGWNEAKRDDRLITFTRIIRKYVGIRIHAKIKHADFDKHIKSIPVPNRSLITDSPYTLLFQQIILAMAARGDLYGVNQPCDFIFDQQVGFSAEIQSQWPQFKDVIKTSSRSDLPALVGDLPIFRDETEFLPLQAADLYAWQMRNYFAQNQNPKLVVPINKVLGQLVQIPMIDRNYEEDELVRLRDHLLEIGKRFAEAHPGVPFVHIGKTKGERKRARRRTRAPKTKR